MMLHRSKLYAAGLLVVTFAAGVAVGTGVSAAANDRPRHENGPERRARQSYADRLGRELQLTPVQRDSVARIVAGYQDSMTAIWQALQPRTDSIRTAIRRNIANLLDSAQQERYRSYIHRTDSARAAREARERHGSR
ncbi:MAG TPA: hypothetical protein VGA02_03705 [Gemmatimonadales bacterium]|jgi:hypothetical protein